MGTLWGVWNDVAGFFNEPGLVECFRWISIKVLFGACGNKIDGF